MKKPSKKNQSHKKSNRVVYVNFVEMGPSYSQRYLVTIHSSSNPLLIRDNHLKRQYAVAINTEQTPREILNALAQTIYEQTKERPDFMDPIAGTPQDNQRKYADYDRRLEYLAEGSWPKKGESQKQATRRSTESNLARNASLFDIYSLFVRTRI